MKKNSFIVFFLFAFSIVSSGQDIGNFSGSFESTTHYYLKDSKLQSIVPPDKVATNNFFLLQYNNGPFSGGIRFEIYLPPLSGFPYQLEGTSIAHRFIRFSKEKIDITAGNFYEQFGSGLIFRAYESRELGINNSVDGIRAIFRPAGFMRITGIYGLQKKYLENGTGILRGADAEINLGEMIKMFPQIKIASGFMSRYQPYTGPLDNYPSAVNAFSYRISASLKKVELTSEYVNKSVDPSSANQFRMVKGEALLVNGNFTSNRFGLFLAFRFLSNMDFRSERESEGNYQMINYLPSNTLQHSFLLGNIYPYSTQSGGEASFQGDLNFSLKKGSFTGGKYGTKFRLNFSHIRNLGTDISGSNILLSAGNKVYFQDLSFEMNRRLTSRLKTIITILNLRYDKSVVEGPGYDFVKATIINTELKYRMTSLFSLRTEIQHLWTKQDKGNWIAGLCELGYAPKWSIFISDMYDYKNNTEKAHYYNTGIAYSGDSFRISAGFGRQREGQICAGGICQRVPAYKGFNLKLNASF